MYIGLFSSDVWLFCSDIGLFCSSTCGFGSARVHCLLYTYMYELTATGGLHLTGNTQQHCNTLQQVSCAREHLTGERTEQLRAPTPCACVPSGHCTHTPLLGT